MQVYDYTVVFRFYIYPCFYHSSRYPLNQLAKTNSNQQTGQARKFLRLSSQLFSLSFHSFSDHLLLLGFHGKHRFFPSRIFQFRCY